MITPQEKAKELVDKMYLITKEDGIYGDLFIAKQCALIAVDEIIDLNLDLSNCDENNWAIEKFYIEVKIEIQKL
jgi:hypothetical protein